MGKTKILFDGDKMNNDDKIKAEILQEYENSNIVISCVDGIKKCSMSKFIEQNADGILYDLNKNESIALIDFPNTEWINNYATSKVVRALKNKISELETQNRAFLQTESKYSIEQVRELLQRQKEATALSLGYSSAMYIYPQDYSVMEKLMLSCPLVI